MHVSLVSLDHGIVIKEGVGILCTGVGGWASVLGDPLFIMCLYFGD